MVFNVKDKKVIRMVKDSIRKAGLEGKVGCTFDDEDKILDVDDLSQSNILFSSASNTFSSDEHIHPAIASGVKLKDFVTSGISNNSRF